MSCLCFNIGIAAERFKIVYEFINSLRSYIGNENNDNNGDDNIFPFPDMINYGFNDDGFDSSSSIDLEWANKIFSGMISCTPNGLHWDGLLNKNDRSKTFQHQWSGSLYNLENHNILIELAQFCMED